MSKEDLEENLGTIAKSGSLAFKEQLENAEDIDIIGQFGVGFYASFMVSKKVEVLTKKYGEKQAYLWTSDASDGYTIEEASKETNGTQITLYLKDNEDDENYDEYLEEHKISSLIKKYSDYIRYPILMNQTKSRKKEDSEEYEDYIEEATLNSRIPLWKRNKKEISEEEYNRFYQSKFYDFNEPSHVIHNHTEGNVTFDALLFIPSKAPMNFYQQDYKKGLQLYSRGVFIMEHAEDLIPDHFRFVRGLVDSQDLSLNISREMLQHDRQLKLIAKRIERKIKDELLAMQRDEREKYEAFFAQFGLNIKVGVYNQFGANKDLLQDLLMYYSSSEKKLVTLKEYVSRMKEDQKEIYFISGESIEKMDRLPQCERVKDKGYEILYMTDGVDEFALQAIMEYEGKSFRNITVGELDLDSEEEKNELLQKNLQNKEILDFLKEALGDEVEEVKLSTRLKTHPVCLVAKDGISFEVEKVLNAMPEGNPYGMKAQRVLEINAEHPIFEALTKIYASHPDKIKDYASLLLDQALLIEGFAIKDPMEFSKKICDLMVEASK
jgi:molecular chaperone HtpG